MRRQSAGDGLKPGSGYRVARRMLAPAMKMAETAVSVEAVSSSDNPRNVI
jgi:hypothetical protein